MPTSRSVINAFLIWCDNQWALSDLMADLSDRNVINTELNSESPEDVLAYLINECQINEEIITQEGDENSQDVSILQRMVVYYKHIAAMRSAALELYAMGIQPTNVNWTGETEKGEWRVY